MPSVSAALSPTGDGRRFSDPVDWIMRLPKNAGRLESQGTGPVVHHGQRHKPRPAERRSGHPTLAALRARLMILNGRADDELMPEHLERPALRGGMNRGDGYGSRRSNA